MTGLQRQGHRQGACLHVRGLHVLLGFPDGLHSALGRNAVKLNEKYGQDSQGVMTWSAVEHDCKRRQMLCKTLTVVSRVQLACMTLKEIHTAAVYFDLKCPTVSWMQSGCRSSLTCCVQEN